ncbi:pyridoxal phosphate-dependent decarboxylase family protein [Actinoplanes solisilvae]|uniref:pyridoxal phosphate-dependent decarboxylase family protein n=1 Tax=Actinoplanes solisilvae TaxID=2486853 RepID=UPI000FDC18CF|nr:aminotransferase class V-fold PLP-dependent enzyme [Actinoplanes solisilvae]
MQQPDWSGPLAAAYGGALAFLTDLPGHPVGASQDREALLAALDGPLPEQPHPAAGVIEQLAAAADPGIMRSTGGRFFGFVVGGSTPAALAADWLTSAWDQNTGLFALAPSATTIEQVAGRWLRELLGLPDDATTGFVTGGQMANFTGLAAARHEMLRRAGWNVEVDGLFGAPRLRVLVGAERHDTIDLALRYLGVGTAAIEVVAADEQGRMDPLALAGALEDADGPIIVCAQAGGVNSGAIDPVGEICDLAHAAGAWVHVDGAFGLWAAASPSRRHLLDGVDRADSWATDAHKWLNVPYDSGLIFCAHPQAHRAALSVRAGYLMHGSGDPFELTPELSRRARGIPVYAALRNLGRTGVAALVEGGCAAATRFAELLAAHPGVRIHNDVTLNQVLVSFDDDDARTRAVVDLVQGDGTCWVSGSVWRGRAVMRISVSNWSTDPSDVDASVQAILRCLQAERATAPASQLEM